MLTKISVSDPSALPVPLETVKQHLRVDHDDEDEVITDLIRAAAEKVEHGSGHALQEAEWEFTADCWPHYWREPIKIPLKPVRDVIDLAYLDTLGIEQAVASTDWYWRRTDEGAEIRLVSGFSGPALYDRPGSVIARLTAGYEDNGASGSGDDPALTMPLALKLAVIMDVKAHYDPPENGTDLEYQRQATQSLIAAERVYR